ncbi:hypothetical protein PsorP6_007496 [Peronosclerospora sorghi]|uniref:Uncharacterized protein n=1 Tax=Peronosclerospora sorghi TaxID=230839 RepID=A0ACC0W8A6_9STRA|nr:hypothetical protein PsorP6_007496 [Peronosclerospora sorghi]
MDVHCLLVRFGSLSMLLESSISQSETKPDLCVLAAILELTIFTVVDQRMKRARGSGKRSSNKHRCVFAPRHSPFVSTSRFRRRCLVAIIEMVCPQAETSPLFSKSATLETKEGGVALLFLFPYTGNV